MTGGSHLRGPPVSGRVRGIGGTRVGAGPRPGWPAAARWPTRVVRTRGGCWAVERGSWPRKERKPFLLFFFFLLAKTEILNYFQCIFQNKFESILRDYFGICF